MRSQRDNPDNPDLSGRSETILISAVAARQSPVAQRGHAQSRDCPLKNPFSSSSAGYVSDEDRGSFNTSGTRRSKNTAGHGSPGTQTTGPTLKERQTRKKKESKQHPTSSISQPTTMHELRQQIFDEAPNGRTWEQRLSNALEVIDDIPEHVADVLYTNMVSISGVIHCEIEAKRQLVKDNADISEASASKVAASLEDISDVVYRSLESKFDTVNVNARTKVNKFIQDVEGTNLCCDDIAEQMWMISDEVQQMTEKAAEDAIQDTQGYLSDLLDHLLIEPSSSSDRLPKQVLSTVKEDLVAQIPQAVHNSEIGMVKAAAIEQVQVAVAELADESARHRPLSNRVVAERILQAKTRRQGIVQMPSPSLFMCSATSRMSWADMTCSEESMSEPADPISLGSVGHPEICARPCLYFASNRCVNGSGCGYCHGAHNERPAHFDKRSRERFKIMTFSECVTVMYPMLKSKIEISNLSEAVMNKLEDLMASAGRGAPISPTSMKARKTFSKVLSSMTLRSLLTTLLTRCRTEVEQGSPEHHALESLVENIKIEAGLRGTWPPCY